MPFHAVELQSVSPSAHQEGVYRPTDEPGELIKRQPLPLTQSLPVAKHSRQRLPELTARAASWICCGRRG